MTELRPVRRALLAVYDKTGVVDVRTRRSASSSVELVSSGGTAAALREAGIEVTEVADVTGFARDARRPGEDPASRDPRGAAGRSARTPSTSPSSTAQGIAPFDLVVGEPVPVPRDGRLGRRVRRRRSRRSTSAAPRWSAPPRRTSGSVARGRRSRRGTRSCSTSSARGRADPRDAVRARRARRSRTPPRTTRRWPAGSPRSRPTPRTCRRSSASPTRRWPTCGTARTPTSAARCSPRSRGPGCWAAPRCCRARRCRSTTGSTRGRRPTWPARCPRARARS